MTISVSDLIRRAVPLTVDLSEFGLEPVNLRYRPFSADMQAKMVGLEQATVSGEPPSRVQVVADQIPLFVTDWDIQDADGKPAVPSVEICRQFDTRIVGRIMDAIWTDQYPKKKPDETSADGSLPVDSSASAQTGTG